MEKTPQKKRRERIAHIVAGAVAALIVIGLLLYWRILVVVATPVLLVNLVV
ncbi:hypothetical protein [Bifidobacterium sp. SO1]|uniref:hypothetical protein n=1 Tax=Bifidobacterium sp. SO1 TaxID=2809029 RepID=UPI001BDC7467|nr:hypothetical protein [Bifidobacterium sp. SO1]MBT1162987.1 hypothetical protein [Bifidobacterium sp. SO1]